jgi:hypothetical protein
MEKTTALPGDFFGCRLLNQLEAIVALHLDSIFGAALFYYYLTDETFTLNEIRKITFNASLLLHSVPKVKGCDPNPEASELLGCSILIEYPD